MKPHQHKVTRKLKENLSDQQLHSLNHAIRGEYEKIAIHIYKNDSNKHSYQDQKIVSSGGRVDLNEIDFLWAFEVRVAGKDFEGELESFICQLTEVDKKHFLLPKQVLQRYFEVTNKVELPEKEIISMKRYRRPTS